VRGEDDPITFRPGGYSEVREATIEECAAAQEALRRFLAHHDECEEYLRTHVLDYSRLDTLERLKRILDQEDDYKPLERIPREWYDIVVTICGGPEACPWQPIE
jgi:hypothetical protein